MNGATSRPAVRLRSRVGAVAGAEADIDGGLTGGVTVDGAAAIGPVEQENRKLNSADETLKRTAIFSGVELDRQQRL